MNAYADIVTPTTVRIERTLPGPIERVWQYLVDGDKRGQWLARGPLDAAPGGGVELHFDNSRLTGHDDPPPPKYAAMDAGNTLHGRVLACDPPHLLEFTWGEAADASQVRFELREVDDRVQLTVTHSGIGSRATMLSVSAGWHTHLDVLADRLAGRAPASFWRTQARLEADYERRIA